MSDAMNSHATAIIERCKAGDIWGADLFTVADHAKALAAELAEATARATAAEAELTRVWDGIKAGMQQDNLASIREHAAAMRRTPYRDQQVLADHEAAIGDQLAVIALRLRDLDAAPGDTEGG